jgi:hypothetical protein
LSSRSGTVTVRLPHSRSSSRRRSRPISHRVARAALLSA